MRARLAFLAVAAAAALLTARPASSRPDDRADDPVARLQAENARLERRLDRTQDALDDIARANQRNRDRATRRAIDRILDDARDHDRDHDHDHDHDHDRDRDHDRDHDHDRDPPQPQAQVLAKADFDALVGRVAAASFESNRLDLVKAAAQSSVFTSDQVVTLMQQSSFDDTRIEIAATLRPRVVDPARWYLVYDALQFDSSRDTLRQRVGQ